MSQGIMFINAAFILYTVGVWSEKIQGELKPRHLFLFWFGVLCDALGTSAMGAMPKHPGDGAIPNLFHFSFVNEFHSLTGFIALALMVLHVAWATVLILHKKDEWLKKFHRYSFIVWLIWLIPFISGIVFHLR